MGTLINEKEYKDLYFGDNLSKVSEERFKGSWVYVKDFEAIKVSGKSISLVFEGINYSANLWVNNILVANKDDFKGVFNVWSFDITEHLKEEGKNRIIVEMFPPKDGDFTMGFVDWAPLPQDKNAGIWRPVSLHVSDAVSIQNTFVNTDVDTETLNKAVLSLSTEVTNHSDREQTGVLRGEVGGVKVEKSFVVPAKSTQKVWITKEDVPALEIDNPALWWPVGMGKPVMQKAHIQCYLDNVISDVHEVDFGIRKVEDYFTPDGHKGIIVNGKKVLIKGGGWVDDLFLMNDTEYNENQVLYTKHMGLNCIRFEGFWGTSQEIYNLCDRHGLLAIVGFSCQWEWHDYVGGPKFNEDDDQIGGAINTDTEIELIANYFIDMTKWLRNHPSIVMWTGGSDRLHPPKLEKNYLEILKEENPNTVFCGAAKAHTSAVTGPTGVKMYGPYDYVPPVYWYTDTEKGGAYGFNTETGPGPQPPVLESMKKMIPAKDLWPMDEKMWNYHSGRHAFANMDRYTKPLYERYGEPKSIEEFCFKSQIQSYEVMRPMFESFIVNKPKTTGIVQWMLNSAWPETFWQLYDYYLHPTGAFYGTQKANQPVLIAYNYGDGAIYVANETYNNLNGYEAEIKVFSSDSKELESTIIKGLTVDPYGVIKLSSKAYNTIQDEHNLYFISLKLRDESGTEVADNFYWLSTKEDVLDWEKGDWKNTPTKSNGDLTYINNLTAPTSEELVVVDDIKQIDSNWVATVTIDNKSDKIAFFIELSVKKERSGETILPVFWSDNYVSLLPGEKRVYTATFAQKDLGDDKPVFSYTGSWEFR